MNRNSSLTTGRVAALALAAAIILFACSLISEFISDTEFAKNVGYVASILIAVSVVIIMACFYDLTRAHLKIFALLALVSAIIYAPFCIATYYLQLSVVALNPLNISSDVLTAIVFNPGSPSFALDMLGYGFLCFSTLAAGFALVEARDKMLRVLCFFHGALVVPTLLSPIISGIYLSTDNQANDIGVFVLLFWCFVFIPIALLFARHFKESTETRGV